jgi:phage gpG-like protein
MEDKFKFGELKQKIEQMKRDLPIVLAAQAESYFVKSWDDQGFNGEPWQEVKRRQEGTPEYKYPKAKDLGRRTRAILVKTGRLRRAVSNSIKSQTFNSVRLVVDLPYAVRHNSGTDGTPKRTFMASTPELTKMHKEKIKEYMSGLWE